MCYFTFTRSHIKKSEKKHVNLILIYILFNPICVNVVSSTSDQFKNINEIFDHFYTESLKSGVYFILTTHFNLNMRFSLEMLDLYLQLKKFTVEKV